MAQPDVTRCCLFAQGKVVASHDRPRLEQGVLACAKVEGGEAVPKKWPNSYFVDGYINLLFFFSVVFLFFSSFCYVFIIHPSM